jgi:hypothetical protein
VFFGVLKKRFSQDSMTRRTVYRITVYVCLCKLSSLFVRCHFPTVHCTVLYILVIQGRVTLRESAGVCQNRIGNLALLYNMYSNRDPIPATLRASLFATPLATLLSSPVTVCQQWLAHYDCLCIFSEAVMASDEPLPPNWDLHSFFRQFHWEPEFAEPPD